MSMTCPTSLTSPQGGFHYNRTGPQVGMATPRFGSDDGGGQDVRSRLLTGITTADEAQTLGLMTVGGSIQNLLAQGINRLGDWAATPVKLSSPADLTHGMSLSDLNLSAEDQKTLIEKAHGLANMAQSIQYLQKSGALKDKQVTALAKSLRKGLEQFQNEPRIQTWLVPLPPMNGADLDALISGLTEDRGAGDRHENARKAQVMADLTRTLELLDQLQPGDSKSGSLSVVA